MGNWDDFKNSTDFRRKVIMNTLLYEDKGTSSHGAPGQQIPGRDKFPMTSRLIFFSAVLEYQKTPSRQQAGFLYRVFLDSFNNRHRRPQLLRYDVQMPAELDNTVRFKFQEYIIQPGSESRQQHFGTRAVSAFAKQPNPRAFDIVTNWLKPILKDFVEAEHVEYEQVGLSNTNSSMTEAARMYMEDLNTMFRNSEGRMIMNTHNIGIAV